MALDVGKLVQDTKVLITNYNLVLNKAAIIDKTRVDRFKEKFNFLEALAFNIAGVIIADSDVGDDQYEFLQAFLREFPIGKRASYYINLFMKKKSPDYIIMNKMYGHDISESDSDNMWQQLSMIIHDDTDLNDIVAPFSAIISNVSLSDGVADDAEVAYIKPFIDTFMNMLANRAEGISTISNERSSADLPLKVTKVGGTTGAKDREGNYSITLGVDIENPNKQKLASGITVEITLADRNGGIVDVITDTLYCIDAGATFHYGCEKTWMKGDVSNISANAYAREFTDVGGKTIMDCAAFSNFSIAHGQGDCDITGRLRSGYSKTINGCILYFQFVKDGKIVGGNNTYVDILPSGASRSLKINTSVDVQAGQLEHSVDFDLRDFLNS